MIIICNKSRGPCRDDHAARRGYRRGVATCQPGRGGGRNIGGTEGRVGKKLRGPPENAVAQGPPYG